MEYARCDAPFQFSGSITFSEKSRARFETNLLSEFESPMYFKRFIALQMGRTGHKNVDSLRLYAPLFIKIKGNLLPFLKDFAPFISIKTTFLGMERFFFHLLVSSHRTTSAHLRNLTRLQLVGDFGNLRPSDKISARLFLNDTKNEKKIGPIFLKFMNMRSPLVGQHKFPRILKYEWSFDDRTYFKVGNFGNSVFLDSDFLAEIKSSNENFLKVFDFQIFFEYVDSFLRDASLN